MKSLVEFIKESKRTDLEYLVNYYDNDDIPQESGLKTTILSAKKLYADNKCLQSCISVEDLEKLYKFRDDNIDKLSDIQKRPEPIVANYNGTKNVAFRRWVKTYQDKMGISINYIKGKAKDTFHDTKLKGNGKEGVFEPSAQDMEDVLCIAYNNLCGVPFENMLSNLTKDRKEKLTKDVDWYNGHSEMMDIIAEKIPPSDKSKQHNGLCKLETKYSKVLSQWSELGSYDKKPDNTPKTDIISMDASGNPITTDLRISIKKAGGSQAMSGNYNESKATILAAIDSLKDKKGIEEHIDAINKYFNDEQYKGWGGILDNLSDGIAKIKKKGEGEEYDRIMKVESMVEPLKDIINNKLLKNKEFRKALLKEAMSGEHKFGIDSPSTATSVFEWDDMEPEKSEYYDTIDDFVENKIVKTNFIIVFKSSGNAWMVMRVIVGNTPQEIEDEEKKSLENVEENN